MSCDQLPLVRRIAVERPKALDLAIWKAHLDVCPECREERFALARSLAVYRQMESQERDAVTPGPTWETFAVTLAREQRWQRMRSRIRAPLAAASVFVAVALGAVLWPIGAGNDPAGLTGEVVPAPRPLTELSGLRSAPVEWRLSQDLLREVGQAGAPAGAVASGLPTSTVTLPSVTMSRNEERPASLSLSLASEPAPAKAASAAAPMEVSGKAGEEPVRTSVLLFRSLRQQQEARRPPVPVLRVSGPAVDLGAHPYAGPRPIR